MVGQASSLSIKNDGQDARRHQILFLFAITFENPYRRRWIPAFAGKTALKTVGFTATG